MLDDDDLDLPELPGGDADAGSRRRIDVFVHLPKAGGTTLRHILLANAWASTLRIGNVFKGSGGYDADPRYDRRIDLVRADPAARLITGHVPIAIRDAMPSAWRVRWFTVVREPVERAISHYYEVLGDEIDSPQRNTQRPSARTVGYAQALNDVDYVPDNLQTRMLCGLPEPFGEMTAEHLEMAIDNLKQLRLVGLAERFDETLVLLERRLGYHTVRYQPARVNETRPRARDVPEELREAARAGNELDAQLYDAATKLFEGYAELADPRLQVQVEALRRVRRMGSRDPMSPPPPGFDGSARAWSWLVEVHQKLILERTDRLRAQQLVWELRQQPGVPPGKRAARIARAEAPRPSAEHSTTSADVASPPAVVSAPPQASESPEPTVVTRRRAPDERGRARGPGKTGRVRAGRSKLRPLSARKKRRPPG